MKRRIDRFEQWVESALFRSVIKRPTSPRRLSAVRLFSVALATVWYAYIAAFFVFTATLLFSDATLLLKVLAVIISLVNIRCLIPGFIEFPPADVIADEEQFPHLNKIVEQVAEIRGVEKPTIVVTELFDAAFGRIGPARRSVLLLGHPLLSVLTPVELTAVIAHELGHARDGAITRSVYVRLPQTGIRAWLRILAPGGGWQKWEKLTQRQRFLTITFAPINLPLTGMDLLFKILCARDAVRAEYEADRFSVKTAGKVDVLQLSRKFLLASIPEVRQAYAQSTPVNRYTALRHMFDRVSLPQQRAGRMRSRDGGGLFSWHPPSELRGLFATAVAPEKPAMHISAEQFSQIHTELRNWPVVIARRERKSLREPSPAEAGVVPGKVSTQD